jgi:dihydroorotate dehydrogenase
MQEEKNIQQIIHSVKEYNQQLALQHGTERKALLVKIAPLTRQREYETQEIKNPDHIEDLTPEGLDILVSASEGNVDGITATNTTKEHNFKEKTQIITATGGQIYGGMSGKELHPQAVTTVKEVRKRTNLPIMGVGGIGYDPENDVHEMEQVGADTIQIISSVIQ